LRDQDALRRGVSKDALQKEIHRWRNLLKGRRSLRERRAFVINIWYQRHVGVGALSALSRSGDTAMKIHVRILGAVAKPMGKDAFDVEVPEGATVERVLVESGYRKEHLKWFLVARNGVDCKMVTAVAPGDEISVVFPTSGG
jgi:molybdopterin converting factor small subunit